MEIQLDTVLQHATRNTSKKEWLEAGMAAAASFCGSGAWPKQVSPVELRKSSTVRLFLIVSD